MSSIRETSVTDALVATTEMILNATSRSKTHPKVCCYVSSREAIVQDTEKRRARLKPVPWPALTMNKELQRYEKSCDCFLTVICSISRYF